MSINFSQALKADWFFERAFNTLMSKTPTPIQILRFFLVVIISSIIMNVASAQQNLPTSEELSVIRAKAHQDRFKKYVLQKLEVYSVVQSQRGMCLDFIGKSDGLYESIFDSGPLMVDLANCGEEGDFIDGRIRALKVLEAREHRGGLTDEQVEQVISEINMLFFGRIYDPEALP